MKEDGKRWILVSFSGAPLCGQLCDTLQLSWHHHSKMNYKQKALAIILACSALGAQPNAPASTRNCILTHNGKTYINGYCKVTWNAGSQSLAFDDEREVILCPDGKLFELGGCAGYQSRYYRHGVHGIIWLGGSKPSLSWNMGITRNNDYGPFTVRQEGDCWITEKTSDGKSVLNDEAITFCYQ